MFKQGDKVIYVSGRFGCSSRNPLFKKYLVYGRVAYISRFGDREDKENLYISVEWPNPVCSNIYHHTDLQKFRCIELTTSFKRF